MDFCHFRVQPNDAEHVQDRPTQRFIMHTGPKWLQAQNLKSTLVGNMFDAYGKFSSRYGYQCRNLIDAMVCPLACMGTSVVQVAEGKPLNHPDWVQTLIGPPLTNTLQQV